jgi:SAM-dependent methyltransferase
LADGRAAVVESRDTRRELGTVDVESGPLYVPSTNDYGRCLRAARDIPAGTFVLRFSGPVVERRDIPSSEIVYALLMTDGRYLIPDNDARLINHSCEPNCVFVNDADVVTAQPVRRGMELSVSYDAIDPADRAARPSMYQWDDRWTFACRCGSARCVGWVGGYRDLEGTVPDERARIRRAVERERQSRDYALHYYDDEWEHAGLRQLDTALLDTLLPKTGRLLDATMGRGRHVLHFGRRGFEVHGNDYNPHMVELVRSDLRAQNLTAQLYQLDVTQLSGLADSMFDYVICMFSSLSCIPGDSNRRRAFAELSRVLRPGGLIVTHAHNRLGVVRDREALEWALRTYLWREKGLERGDWLFTHGHLGETFLHLFSPRELSRLFRQAGLIIKKEIYLNAVQDDYYRGAFARLRSGGMIFVGQRPAVPADDR